MNSPKTKPTLNDIGKGLASVKGVANPDSIDLLEQAAVERTQLENKLARSRIKNVKADRKMRKKYAGRVLRYLEIYSIAVASLVIFSGFELWGFDLPVEILASLVGSTALAASGLVGFVARGLFKPPPSSGD